MAKALTIFPNELALEIIPSVQEWVLFVQPHARDFAAFNGKQGKTWQAYKTVVERIFFCQTKEPIHCRLEGPQRENRVTPAAWYRPNPDWEATEEQILRDLVEEGLALAHFLIRAENAAGKTEYIEKITFHMRTAPSGPENAYNDQTYFWFTGPSLAQAMELIDALRVLIQSIGRQRGRSNPSDHVIIGAPAPGRNRYFSFKETGAIPS